MKRYVAVAGALAGLLAASHVLRYLAEGPELLRNPWWVLATRVSFAMAGWAVALLRRPADAAGGAQPAPRS